MWGCELLWIVSLPLRSIYNITTLYNWFWSPIFIKSVAFPLTVRARTTWQAREYASSCHSALCWRAHSESINPAGSRRQIFEESAPCLQLNYPLVNIQKAMENGHWNSGFSHKKMVIFHCYVSSPEGMRTARIKSFEAAWDIAKHSARLRNRVAQLQWSILAASKVEPQREVGSALGV